MSVVTAPLSPGGTTSTVLLESRPFRPFRSSEEYLYAMREDLAEWMNCLYPELCINVDNFMDRLENGIALCKHANNVRTSAQEYVSRRAARRAMTRSTTTTLATPVISMGTVPFLPTARRGTFFARDNVSNFIYWCRKSLGIFECLLFETEDLIMRKNEKHVILCLLEVARRGAKFGMLAPMLVQMERQIDREIAADNLAQSTQGGGDGASNDDGKLGDCSDGKTGRHGIAGDDLFDTDSETEEENEDVMLVYGPQPQIVTNDLKSLDEMVRDLVERCTCPSQFPMVRVSEGKYRIGDTKVLIFVRILRSHVMVRVGGGWDTLSHFLDKHDPCRCRAQHRQPVSSRIVTKAPPGPQGMDLTRAQVHYDRSPPTTRRGSVSTNVPLSLLAPPTSGNRSRSPTPQRTSYENQAFDIQHKSTPNHFSRRSVSPRRTDISRRSVSPNPRVKSVDTNAQNLKNKNKVSSSEDQVKRASLISLPPTNFEPNLVSEANIQIFDSSAKSEAAAKFENISDNGSEVSDEGYRSLGIIKDGVMIHNGGVNKRQSLHSQASTEDAEYSARLDQASDGSQVSTGDDSPKTINSDTFNGNSDDTVTSDVTDSGPKSIDYSYVNNEICNNTNTNTEPTTIQATKKPTSDISSSTGLRKTFFSHNLYGDEKNPKKIESKIPRSPVVIRRKSIDNTSDAGSIKSLTSSSVKRASPVYRSVRKPNVNSSTPNINNTWNGRQQNGRKRAPITTDTFNEPKSTFTRNSPLRATVNHTEYDKNGRRIKSASLNTSPSKTMPPLAQQILQTAETAQSDSQIFEKMKSLLHKYEKQLNKKSSIPASPKSTRKTVKLPPKVTKPIKSNSHSRESSVDYDDFTTAWVHSNGTLDRRTSKDKDEGKVSESNSLKEAVANSISNLAVGSPRKDPKPDKTISRIPTPIRAATELY